jgi:hypothetical protein
MHRSWKVWFGALGLLAASACTEEDPTACAPYCGSPVLTGDGGGALPGSTGGAAPGSTGGIAPGGTGGVAPGSTAGAVPGSTGGATPGAGGTPGTPGLDAGALPGGGSDGGTIVPVVDGGRGGTDASTPTADGAAGDASGGGTPGQMLPAVTDYTKPGPFKTTTQANVGPNNGYTIFRPDPLGANGFRHSPIIFGPGILTSASGYSAILTHLASHGFVTICVNEMWEGPGGAGNLSAMTMGLDWLLAQNDQAGVFQGKLAVDRAVAMGYSIGATASVQLASHKAIATTVVIHGHRTMGNPHGPVLMITGTSDVIGDMRATLMTLEEAPAVLVALPIGHLDVLTELPVSFLGGGSISASARYVAPITAWLRYWINGDQAAKRYFWGDGCEMCKSPWIPPEPNAKWKAQML